MRLISLEVPEDPAQLSDWLERHLAALDLAALVAELEVIHGHAEGTTPTLGSLLGEQRDAVLVRGLGTLAPDRLRTLLRHPRLMLELQDLVLLEGSDYWERLVTSDPKTHALQERGRIRLDALVNTGETGGRSVVSRPRSRSWSRQPWVVSLATAAAVWAILTYVTGAHECGWLRKDALQPNLLPTAYLNRIADLAPECLAECPQNPNPADLSRTIAELRQGCSRLILADHKPLRTDDRKWLVDHCRDWAVKFDKQRQGVENGASPQAIRAETEETVKKLISALRDKATRVT